MAKSVNVVYCIIEGGTPEFASFHSPADAAVFFKKKVKELMTGKMSSHYKGVTPMPGYFHKVTPTSYELFHLSGSGAKLYDVVCKIGSSMLYKPGESPDGASATASPGAVTAASPAPAPASAPASTPSGVVGPKGVPGVPVPSTPSGKTTIMVGGKAIEIDQAVLTAAIGAALAGAGVGDEDGDGEFNEEDDD